MLLEKLKNYEIILASKSPRRQFLLKELGIDFETAEIEIDEKYPDNLLREQIALYLCELKANAFKFVNNNEKTLVITADTIVWFNNQVLNKPKDFDEAVEMLQRLSGEKHQVYTAVCLKTKNKQKSFFACSDVYFRNLTKEEIYWYVENCKPYDKAGAYGAQEWLGYIGIERIEGSYFNVVGLPTQKLFDELMKFIEIESV